MQTTRITVAISTYNRDKFIVACLNCLAVQTLDKTLWEVVVVDNHCTDNTASLVQDFIQRHPQLPFRYVFEGQKGLSYGRNRGIAEAKGDIILYLDDDAEAQPDLLKNYLGFFDAHPGAAGAGGRIIPKYSEAPEPVWMNRYLNGYVVKMDLGEPARLYSGRMKYPYGCNMVYRKKYLDEIGGFDTQLTFRGDDKYIYLAIKAINPNIYYVPQAMVYHNIPGKRLNFDYFKTLFLKTGNEEKLRVKHAGGGFAVFKKLVEYVIKFGVSLAIWLLYTLQGKEIKGRYVMYSQWFTLKGFGMRQVYVR